MLLTDVVKGESWEHAKKKRKKPTKEDKARRRKKRKTAVASVLLYPLLPFKPFMKKALQKKGVPMPKRTKLATMVKQFYEYVMQNKPYKKSNFDGSNWCPDEEWSLADYSYFCNLDLTAVDSFDSLDQEQQEHVAVELAADVIKSILNWIKGLVNKKKNGGELTPAENAVAGVYDETENKINEAAADAVEERAGEVLLSPKGIAILLALGVGGYLIGRK